MVLLVGHQRLNQRQCRISALVSTLNESSALSHTPIGRTVDLHIIIGWIGRAVGQLGSDQAQELMLELVGRRVAHHRQIGFVVREDVLDDRVVTGLPVKALLT